MNRPARSSRAYDVVYEDTVESPLGLGFDMFTWSYKTKTLFSLDLEVTLTEYPHIEYNGEYTSESYSYLVKHGDDVLYSDSSYLGHPQCPHPQWDGPSEKSI